MMAKNIRWDLDQAKRAGQGTLKLLETHGPAIAYRLAAGLAEGLKNDVPMLDESKIGKPVAVMQTVSQTASERQIAEKAATFVGLIRKNLKEHIAAGDPLLKAVGVGRAIRAEVTSSVQAALKATVDEFQKSAERFRASSVGDGDIAKCTDYLASLTTADQAQDAGQTSKSDYARSVLAVQKRVEDAVLKIAAAGELHFSEDESVAKLFRALVPALPVPRPPKAKKLEGAGSEKK